MHCAQLLTGLVLTHKADQNLILAILKEQAFKPGNVHINKTNAIPVLLLMKEK